MNFTKWTAGTALSALLLAGCSKSPVAASADGATKIRVGYIGITCEAPIFTAVEKGFFTEEGLEVELVKCEWANYKDVLALGGFDEDLGYACDYEMWMKLCVENRVGFLAQPLVRYRPKVNIHAALQASIGETGCSA